MPDDLEWDESTAGTPWYKGIDLTFLADMVGDFCTAEHEYWETTRQCIRLPGHTGRHLAVEWQCRYPVAVWR